MRFRCMTPLVILLGLLVTGCGGVHHVATVSVVSTHATLSAIQDTADAVTCGAAGALSAPNCLSTAQRQAVAEKLSPAFGLDVALATAVRDWPAGTPQPAAIAVYLGQITALVNQVIDALPNGAAKTKLLGLIGGK